MGRWEPDAPVAFLWQRWSCSGMAAMSRRLLPTSPRVPVSPRARSFATSPTSEVLFHWCERLQQKMLDGLGNAGKRLGHGGDRCRVGCDGRFLR